MAGREAVSGLVAGVGLRAGTAAEEILACIDLALGAIGARRDEIARLATLATRSGEDGLAAAARTLGSPVSAIPDEALRGFEAGCATRSTRIQSLYGVGSVAEAAALAAAGPGGVLVQPRVTTQRVTCALARTDLP